MGGGGVPTEPTEYTEEFGEGDLKRRRSVAWRTWRRNVRASENFLPAGEFAAEVAGHAGESARGRGATQVQREKESLAGEGGVGEIARVAEIGREVVATPNAGA